MSTHSHERGRRHHHGGTDPAIDAGTDTGLGPMLAEAMSELRRHEPGMPDLLGPAMLRGARIRRRRRTNLLLALSTAVAVTIGSVVGTLVYSGREGGLVAPAASPTAGTSSIGPGRPQQPLVDVLQPYMRRFDVDLVRKPWSVARDEHGSKVFIGVEDARGNTTSLALSTGRTAAPLPPTTTEAGCAIPAELDQPKEVEYGVQVGDCRIWPSDSGAGVTWAVHIDAGTSRVERLGAVHIGNDRTISRAWTYGRPSGPSSAPPEFVLDRAMLAEIAADPAVAAAVDRLPLTGAPGDLPSS